jgi:hypothetical protein
LNLRQANSIAGGEYDGCAHQGEPPGNGLADSARGPCNDSYLAGQLFFGHL